MNWNHLLSSLRPELLKEILAEFKLGITSDVSLMKKTIISFLKRSDVEDEKKLIEYLQKNIIIPFHMMDHHYGFRIIQENNHIYYNYVSLSLPLRINFHLKALKTFSNTLWIT